MKLERSYRQVNNLNISEDTWFYAMAKVPFTMNRMPYRLQNWKQDIEEIEWALLVIKQFFKQEEKRGTNLEDWNSED